MSKVIFAIVALFSFSVFAQDARQFAGKFSLAASKNCELTDRTNADARAYVTLNRHKYHNGLLSLDITAYGEDAVGEVIVLENGKFRTVGTSESHGIVTDTVTTKWLAPNRIVVNVLTERPSLNFKRLRAYDISSSPAGMVIRSSVNQDPRSNSICTFTRK